MTDQDIIRKAVDLADGLSISVDEVAGELLWTPEGAASLDGQIARDIIAAQLVRQVDAITNKHGACRSYPDFESYPDGSHLFFGCDVKGREKNITIKGPDRTMNTIKAIVDSKVLE